MVYRVAPDGADRMARRRPERRRARRGLLGPLPRQASGLRTEGAVLAHYLVFGLRHEEALGLLSAQIAGASFHDDHVARTFGIVATSRGKRKALDNAG